jgi:hypothetical protein
MSNVPLTTEGRIFARQVWREFQQREPKDASLFAGKTVTTWEEAIFPLYERGWRDPRGPFTHNAMASAAKRLMTSPSADRCFLFNDDRYDLLTVHASDSHTLTVMDGEREQALIVQQHPFKQGCCGITVANVSDHALGRLYERTDPKPTLRDGVVFVIMCGHIGAEIATQRHLVHSDICLNLGDGNVAMGNVKLSDQGKTGRALAWFDCRTVLPEKACTEAQLEQAQVLNAVLSRRDHVSNVRHIPMRPDYVMSVLDMSKKPPN